MAQNYRIKSGDTILIEVSEDTTLNRELLVTPGGMITFPPVGQVRASGRTLKQIESALSTALRPNFAETPNVFVSLRALRPRIPREPPLPEETMTVYVTGEMNTPGALQVRLKTSLLQLVAAAGGPTRFAATNRIQLRRADPKTGQERLYQFDIEQVLKGRGSAPAFLVKEGDVLIVPERRLFE
ncbi:hypothetical protein GCM10007385_15690 [Tateyamaria omphalii]|nr:hypothetical protein GCM10007385_15690 [Tateyamaria omphalii]